LNNKGITFQSKHQKRQIRPPTPGRSFFPLSGIDSVADLS